ncbi:hypothetical protein TNCV_938561 [Trichonephila clavipes]|nr:hypothetical protein TNCV_938561 [Trichonephila clavipes]
MQWKSSGNLGMKYHIKLKRAFERNCVLYFFVTETKMGTVPEPNEIGNVIEDVVDRAGQINLEVDSVDIQELPDSHNQDS